MQCAYTVLLSMMLFNPVAAALDAYGGGLGLIHYQGFHCHGNESHLVNCTVKYSGLEVVYCRHSHDAGVRCPNGLAWYAVTEFIYSTNQSHENSNR